MADFSEWGGGGGISAAINDQQTIAHTGLLDAQVGLTNAHTAMQQAELQDMPLKRQKMAADITNTLAMAGLHTTDTSLKQEALRRSQAMSQKMQEMGQNPGNSGGDPTDMMIGLASDMVKTAMSVGAVNDAEHWTGALNQLVGHKNTAMMHAAQAKHAEQLERISDYDDIARQVRTIQALPLDQQVPAYNDMNRYFTKKRGEPVPWLGMQWSPQTAKVLEEQALSQKDKELADFRQQKNDEINARKQAELTVKETQAMLREAKAARDQDQKDAATKIAGLKAEAPPKEEVAAASALIKKQFPDIDPDALSLAAPDIAADARAIKLSRPGLNMSDARGIAILNKKSQFEDEKGDYWGTKTVYSGGTPGSSPTLALPLPATPTEFKVGKYYTNPAGIVAQWAKKPDGTYGLKKVAQ